MGGAWVSYYSLSDDEYKQVTVQGVERFGSNDAAT